MLNCKRVLIESNIILNIVLGRTKIRRYKIFKRIKQFHINIPLYANTIKVLDSGKCYPCVLMHLLRILSIMHAWCPKNVHTCAWLMIF